MKKILWCGGSHLGTAKESIRSIFAKYDNEFYITAAPKNRDWSKIGGKYFVDGSIVGDNAHEPGRRVDLGAFDRIIFVGQYIQPQRYVRPSQLLSSALLKAVLHRDDLFIRLPGGIFNEPLSLFPRIAKKNCVLLCDPWIVSNRSNLLPVEFMQGFKKKLTNYCLKNSILLLFQPNSTVKWGFYTRRGFRRSSNDKWHFNDDFWRLYIQSLKDKFD